MGDPVRALQARSMIEVINRDSLVDSTANVGDYLYSHLAAMAADSGAGAGKIHNLRGEGQGTFIAFDAVDGAARDRFVDGMRKVGVNMGGCGERAVRLRYVLARFEVVH